MSWHNWVVEVLFGLCIAVTALGYLYFLIGEQRVQRVVRWFQRAR